MENAPNLQALVLESHVTGSCRFLPMNEVDESMISINIKEGIWSPVPLKPSENNKFLIGIQCRIPKGDDKNPVVGVYDLSNAWQLDHAITHRAIVRLKSNRFKAEIKTYKPEK